MVETAKLHNFEVLIIADHGNADCMTNAAGMPHTAHTAVPVPVILVTNESNVTLKSGVLADISPTILQILGINKPEEMTGTSLI